MANDQVTACADILALHDRLVSPFCGVIRKLHRVHKDILEPAIPYIWRAEIANHRFTKSENDHTVVASGKGLSQAAAIRSALGESVERYCALRFPTAGCKIAMRRDLEGRTLDPVTLVLHTPEQLKSLSYQQYCDDTELSWVLGEDMMEGEFVLSEFIDRFGPRMAHISGILQMLSHLGNPPGDNAG